MGLSGLLTAASVAKTQAGEQFNSIIYDVEEGKALTPLLTVDIEVKNLLVASGTMTNLRSSPLWLQCGVASATVIGSIVSQFLDACTTDAVPNTTAKELHANPAAAAGAHKLHCPAATGASSPRNDIEWLLRLRLQLFVLFVRLCGMETLTEEASAVSLQGCWVISLVASVAVAAYVDSSAGGAPPYHGTVETPIMQTSFRMDSKRRKVFLSEASNKVRALLSFPTNAFHDSIGSDRITAEPLSLTSKIQEFFASLKNPLSAVAISPTATSDAVLGSCYGNGYSNGSDHDILVGDAERPWSAMKDVLVLLLSDATAEQVISWSAWRAAEVKNSAAALQMLNSTLDALAGSTSAIKYFSDSVAIMFNTSSDNYADARTLFSLASAASPGAAFMRALLDDAAGKLTSTVESVIRLHGRHLLEGSSDQEIIDSTLCVFSSVLKCFNRVRMATHMHANFVQLKPLVTSGDSMQGLLQAAHPLHITLEYLTNRLCALTPPTSSAHSSFEWRSWEGYRRCRKGLIDCIASCLHPAQAVYPVFLKHSARVNDRSATLSTRDFTASESLLDDLCRLSLQLDSDCSSSLAKYYSFLVSCCQQEGFMLCPAVKVIATSSPRIEPSVPSPKGDFVLGECVRMICCVCHWDSSCSCAYFFY
jgi:hypothetical protein